MPAVPIPTSPVRAAVMVARQAAANAAARQRQMAVARQAQPTLAGRPAMGLIIPPGAQTAAPQRAPAPNRPADLRYQRQQAQRLAARQQANQAAAQQRALRIGAQVAQAQAQAR
jgi:hypothetical protein